MLCAAWAVLTAVCGCEERLPAPVKDKDEAEKTFIIYSCGHNNLSRDLLKDIEDICSTSPYTVMGGNYRVLVFSHSAKGNSWNIACKPVLMQVYRNSDGHVKRDTIQTWKSEYDDKGHLKEGTYTGSDTRTLKEVLDIIKTQFPSKEYGLLFSSHGTGWLPYNYYNTGRITKSMGADYTGAGIMGVPSEMEVTDFARTIRESGMKFRYMLLDACFMGGVETAYEFRDICDYIMASPTEIWSGGFMYSTMLDHLFAHAAPDLKAMCKAYMSQYKVATISLIDCSKLEQLSAVCKNIFEKYRTAIASVNERQVQGFFRRTGDYYSEKHWFYDLEDILDKAGITQEDRTRLDASLRDCIIYKAASERLFDGWECKAFCGLSMYLPCVGDADLDNYYRRYEWNKASGLVK